MLRTFLTPISARFSSTSVPQTPNKPEDDEADPEDFARDVLMEILRNSIERLKVAQDAQSKIEVLTEIQRILPEDSCTKDVFRELDGFLLLIHTLTTLDVGHPSIEEILEQIRLVFTIISEALKRHPVNSESFSQGGMGYESLSQATSSLILDPRTKLQTLGNLLSLALQDFSLSQYFESIEGQADSSFAELWSNPQFIHQPSALRALWDLFPKLDPIFRHAILKIMERLASQCHRNKAVISNMKIVSPLFRMFLEYKKDSPERSVIQKILRRILDLGASTDETRCILRHVVQDESLNSDVLEVIRNAAKGKWPGHLSLESPAALSFRVETVRGVPPTGFTFMAWVWIERLPKDSSQVVFGLRLNDEWVVCLSLRADGKLTFKSAGNRDTAVFPNSDIAKSRWTHIALVHYTHRAMFPTIRLFVDGILTDSINWAYPKPDSSGTSASYVIGDDSTSARMRWCLASSYLFSIPLDDNLFRFIHHFGPRYASSFQSKELIKLLTYEASTSLNIFLFNAASISQVPPQALIDAIKFGINVTDEDFIFVLTPDVLQQDDPTSKSVASGVSSTFLEKPRNRWAKRGDLVMVDVCCFDTAMWKLGGAAIALRLIQLANSSHELSRALGTLTDSLRDNWQNSEDMERLRGYDILGYLLRSKSHLINMTGFEILFEFIGMNFRSPDHSTIVNSVAYRGIALDFILWSKTKKEIQRAHLDHFATLLDTSKYKLFNIKQRFNKMGVVRKLLFVLQTDLYQPDLLPPILEALRSVVRVQFHQDETIKPLLSMLAANLHDDYTLAGSPRSVISRIDHGHLKEKAESVLEMLVSILTSSLPLLQRFAAAVPLPRICLLLIGERPSPAVAAQVLLLIGTLINASNTFIKKFDVVSGWNVLKDVLPYGWDNTVHTIAFGILLGRIGKNPQNPANDMAVVACPNITPAIISALHHGLDLLITDLQFSSDSLLRTEDFYRMKGSDLETLVEELIQLHPRSLSFRQIFKSLQTTQEFLDAYKSFTAGIGACPEIDQNIIVLMDKLTHFALALALDSSVSTSQQQELFEAVGAAQAVLNPEAQPTPIDPKLIPRGLFGTRIMTGRISGQLGERTAQKSILRNLQWRKSIIVSEKKRLKRIKLDLRENQRQVAGMMNWKTLVNNERGLWPGPSKTRLWCLDETEGPYRVRKKLEPSVNLADYKVTARFESNLDLEVQPVVEVDVSSWTNSESYELSATDVEDQLADEVAEDKHRRIRHELESGDVIEAVVTVARIVGVDSSPGLLIFGRMSLYFMDGLVENDDGEVIDAHDAPKRLLFIPGSVVDLDGHQNARKWAYDQVLNFTNRAFLFRDVGIEIYFRDSRSLLLVFLDKKHRQSVHQRLSSVISHRAATGPKSANLLKTPLLGRVGSRFLSGFRPDELADTQKKWQTREISNFTYLSILNQLSGRTPSDATQYPVFPWVLQDYSSETLNLKSPASFRDLTKPMGALTEGRRELAIARYSNLESVDEKPFHYGTHFSSSMIVCHFLIRLAPFTNMFRTLQGGDWDLPDRLFTSVKRAYESASQDVRGDVRELIPEFFTCPEFLQNLANLDFGTELNNGEKIHDVKLPPWAMTDPFLFVTLNRRALESDFVSQNLHSWIDLIWGYRQGDPNSLNVYHPLSYEGSIDLDKITDDLEREATVGIIHNFGQTPRKMFNAPHPPRIMQGTSTLPLGTLFGIEENFQLLEQSNTAVGALALAVPVRSIVVDPTSGGVAPYADGALSVPLYPNEQIQWQSSYGSMRVLVDKKVIQVVEAAFCSCAVFADSDSLVTGSEDHTVRLWKLTRIVQEPLRVTLSHIMRAHEKPVICIAASRAWSMIVSGSKDGSAVLWDLNKGAYVTSICHGEEDKDEVHSVAVNESTGYIATCSKRKLCLHTVNARQIVMLDLTSAPFYPPILSLAFLEREYSNLGILATGGIDGTITLRTWNTDNTPNGQKAVWEFRTLRELLVRKMGAGRGRDIPVTALRFVGESLYHGQEDGKVYSWSFPEHSM